MSEFYDAADAISAHLATLPALSEVPIVVDRQRDVASELRKAIARQTGCLVLVTWTGAPNEDASADGPRFVSRYTVTVFSKPVIKAGDTPADDVVEVIAVGLHDFRPTERYHDRLIVTGIDPVANEELLIYRINVSAPSQL